LHNAPLGPLSVWNHLITPSISLTLLPLPLLFSPPPPLSSSFPPTSLPPLYHPPPSYHVGLFLLSGFDGMFSPPGRSSRREIWFSIDFASPSIDCANSTSFIGTPPPVSLQPSRDTLFHLPIFLFFPRLRGCLSLPAPPDSLVTPSPSSDFFFFPRLFGHIEENLSIILFPFT